MHHRAALLGQTDAHRRLLLLRVVCCLPSGAELPGDDYAHWAGVGQASREETANYNVLFEALGLSLCRELPVRQAANQMRVAAKRLWRRVRYYVEMARAKDNMSGVRYVGIDETSVKRGHEYITVVHDLEAKRLLFACPGREPSNPEDLCR